MRILVFDDKEVNRKAAEAQLKGHDLTVVGTYDEAQKLLESQIDGEKASAILKGQFGDFNPYCSDDKMKKSEYFAARKVADEQATTYPNFDVVLTDLLVPASRQSQSPDSRLRFAGQEMPVGIFIGLLAAVRGNVRHVAVFTDSNHHSHPASACFDAFNYYYGPAEPLVFMVDQCKTILCNGGWICHFDPHDLTRPLEYKEWSKRSDTIIVKDWAGLLNYLLIA